MFLHQASRNPETAQPTSDARGVANIVLLSRSGMVSATIAE
jgi:hypothetical protein